MSSQVSKVTRLPAALLKKSCVDVFSAVGVPAADARTIAETLVLTDMVPGGLRRHQALWLQQGL